MNSARREPAARALPALPLRTGERLCADWRSGESTDATDQILLAGGIHADHLAAFTGITHRDLCPDVTP